MSFQDHFSCHAGGYARHRPGYPRELFDYLATLTACHAVALDCATGSGQAAVGLARHFERVVASDGSITQLKNARAHPQVVYIANLAEQPAVRARSVDLAVAAQAAHWFDLERFHPAMRRVLKPEGALAIWTYGLALIEPAIDALVQHFYTAVVGPYWPPERRHVESAYRNLPFPWREVVAPAFQLHLHWHLDNFMGYIGTWSAVQRYMQATGIDPLPGLRAEMAVHWNSAATPRSVIWPLHLRVGRP